MVSKSHAFFRYEVEGKKYDSIDKLREHKRLSANPIVKVFYVCLSGKEFNVMDVAFFKMFNKN